MQVLCLLYSYPEVPKSSTPRVKDCHHCSTSVCDDPVLQESAATKLGKDMSTFLLIMAAH